MIVESVVVPDGGDIGSNSKLQPGDADGSGLVTAPPPPTPLQSSFTARLAGWLLRLLGHLSAVRSWVWRSAATAGSAERLGAPTAVGVIGMAGSPVGELGGNVP